MKLRNLIMIKVCANKLKYLLIEEVDLTGVGIPKPA